jgi:hypothetical protein
MAWKRLNVDNLKLCFKNKSFNEWNTFLDSEKRPIFDFMLLIIGLN